VEQEAIAVAAEDKRYIKGIAVGQCLLHTVPQAVLVVLGFNDRYGLVLLVAQHIIGAALLATCMEFTPYYDATSRERDFLANLGLDIPPGLLNGRRDVLGADIPFTELFFVHMPAACWCPFPMLGL